MRVGIPGSGMMGGKLGTIFARAGLSLVYCGDDAISKRIAAEPIHDVGFDPVDTGPLRIARLIEPFSLLVARFARFGG